LSGTLAERYLRARGIADLSDLRALRFHPSCHYRRENGRAEPWPAMIATVTDSAGNVTGLQRTFLERSGRGKASIQSPRRSLGRIGGNAVRFGRADDVMLAGEGIETVLSLRIILPDMPMAAALSAGNLGRLEPPAPLRRLYVAQDLDAAGKCAAETLAGRARALGIETTILLPRLSDFNDDLRRFGSEALRRQVRACLAAEDRTRFLA
jgi:phage/plasmid primase-like uncharacterized protein